MDLPNVEYEYVGLLLGGLIPYIIIDLSSKMDRRKGAIEAVEVQPICWTTSYEGYYARLYISYHYKLWGEEQAPVLCMSRMIHLNTMFMKLNFN